MQRHGNDLLIPHIDLLREIVTSVRSRHPFEIHGWVVLPEHMHVTGNQPARVGRNFYCAARYLLRYHHHA